MMKVTRKARELRTRLSPVWNMSWMSRYMYSGGPLATRPTPGGVWMNPLGQTKPSMRRHLPRGGSRRGMWK